MLILTRKPGESVYIGDNIKITVVEIKGNQIRVGLDAPKDMRIYREEIYLQILEENKQAAETSMVAGNELDNLSAAWDEHKKGSTETTNSGNIKLNRLKTAAGTPENGPQVVIKRKKPNNDK